MTIPNPLTDPARRPDGYVAVHCAGCGAFIHWCYPPVPPVDTICADCALGSAAKVDPNEVAR